MGSNNEVSLRVAEARTRDVGRLIVRIPQRYMRVLGIEPGGEYVEIIGNKRSAYAQVWPAYTDDEDKDYIRMDGVLSKMPASVLVMLLRLGRLI